MCFFICGAKETRTPDPLHAMQMLYQLSYSPVSRRLIKRKKSCFSNWFCRFFGMEAVINAK